MMIRLPIRAALAALIAVGCLSGRAHLSAQVTDTAAIEAETLEHFQALLRLDTSNPPGNEARAVDYLKAVLDTAGIPNQVFATDPTRPNLVARLKGNGRKRPILIMGHTDVVTVDPKKWTHPPFGAAREGGYVYGRGAVDDKDNLVASLMLMLMLDRAKVALDRDVIFLAEAGEEGHAAGRRAVHDRPALRRHRRRVLPRRRRRRGAHRRRDACAPTSGRRRRSRGRSSSWPAVRPVTARCRSGPTRSRC